MPATRRAMLGLAMNRLRDRGRAEDAVQEAFTSIWRAAATYQPELGPGASWMYAVARNAIISRWRKRPEPAAEPFDEPSSEPGPPSAPSRRWRSFCVHRALETLPDHQRQLVELAYWGELSQSEIAARLELPLGTVKTRTRASAEAAGRGAERGHAMTPDFDELVGDEGSPEELRRAAPGPRPARSPPTPPPKLEAHRAGGHLASVVDPAIVGRRRRRACRGGVGRGRARDRLHARPRRLPDRLRPPDARGRIGGNASALIKVGKEDANGNRPLRMSVPGAPDALQRRLVRALPDQEG